MSDPTSKLHVETARHVEKELYKLVKTNVSDIIAVKVNSFANGSVLVDFYLVLNSTVAENQDTPDKLKAALKNAAANKGTYTSLHINPDNEHEISGK